MFGDGVVRLDALADDAPSHPVGRQEVVLRIGHDKSRAARVDFQTGIGELGRGPLDGRERAFQTSFKKIT
jgi:hypothetical protein